MRVVIVTGEGRAFCAGADLAAGSGTFSHEGVPLRPDGGIDYSSEAARDTGGRVSLRIFNCLKTVIAAINGPAVGFGVTMTLAMDVRRVWHVGLPPGGWLTFHRHVLDYFWTTPSAGIARGCYQNGRIVDVYRYPGETRHFRHGKDEYFVHAIENVGDTELIFITVEFLLGDNPPIPLADSVRLVHRRPELAASDAVDA